MQNEIPKIIHYCWFGDKDQDNLTKKCIQTWKEKLPDYKFMFWNEDSFNINISEFTKNAYKERRWSFLSDYVRIWALYEYGGIYLDTDVEVVKSFTPLLNNNVFMGFETTGKLGTATIGTVKKHKFIEHILNYYEENSLYDNKGNIKNIPNTNIITDIAIELGLNLENNYQVINKDIAIYSSEYFCAKNWSDRKIIQTKETYCIHHFSGSWYSDGEKKSIKSFLRNSMIKIIGKDRYFKYNYRIRKIILK